jgi:NAD(P)H-hydrate epimerase
MLLSREQVRSLDRRAIEEYGIPSLVLMENAGRGTADVLCSLSAKGPIVICCGKGNNGGDGLVAARHLVNRGLAVKIFLFAELASLSEEAAVHWKIVERMDIPRTVLTDADQPARELPAELARAEWIVDALFGTGLTGPLRPPLDLVAELINLSGKKVLAVDIPSGLDADTGLQLGATVRAAHTVTFVAGKKGFANPAAAQWLGQIHLVDIGAPRRLIEEFLSEPAVKAEGGA